MKTQVLIIGAGATGTGLARDLALRGVNCILVEKRDVNAGASGGNHGLLHSGARYVAKDAESAAECKQEGDILKKMASQCIEETGGLFVAISGDDEKYIADFPKLCENAGLPVSTIDTKEASDMEPGLSRNIIAAYGVEDASVDPFRLSLENLAHARKLGTVYLRRSRVTGFEIEKGKIVKVNLLNEFNGNSFSIEPQQVVNASGAWAGEIAGMAGAKLAMTYSKGTLLVTHNRINQRVINRLRPPSDGDILVPGGTVSILGTTSLNVKDLDNLQPTYDEVDLNVEIGAQMFPSLETTRYIRAYSGVRPLLGGSSGASRSLSRSFVCVDHESDGLTNFTTITGGKLTTYRLMAEKTADLVCKRLNISSPCLTREVPLPVSDTPRWTEPGLAARLWFKDHSLDDTLLCECEMVSKSVVDNILQSFPDNEEKPKLLDIGRRSRVGKGSCQGAFCGNRILAYLYDKGARQGDEGLNDLKEFLGTRYRGERPMFWDMAQIQAQLQEALHCGLYGLELYS
jgi:glycerol-3-phosphate dehydrogenase